MPVKIEKKTGNKSVLLTFIQYDMQFTEMRQNFMISYLNAISWWKIFYSKQIENIVSPKENLLSIMNTVELFPSCEGILRKKRKKWRK